MDDYAGLRPGEARLTLEVDSTGRLPDERRFVDEIIDWLTASEYAVVSRQSLGGLLGEIGPRYVPGVSSETWRMIAVAAITRAIDRRRQPPEPPEAA